MYTTVNFKTKKALKEAVAAGSQILIYQPGPFNTGAIRSASTFSVEGPHYPQPHKWYATVKTNDQGFVVEVK